MGKKDSLKIKAKTVPVYILFKFNIFNKFPIIQSLE